jgi:hypothetical protein
VQPLLQWRSISIFYFECVFVALVIQHAMRMRRVTFSSVACPAVQYFSTLFRIWQILENISLNIKCVL